MTTDLDGSTDLAAYRSRVRAWLDAHVPTGLDANAPDPAAARAFTAALHDAGLSGISWPREYGGAGLSPAEEQVFAEEAGEYVLPSRLFLISLGICGPTIRDLGTDEQRRRLLPRLLRAEDVYCQLFSEPAAGSDLAAIGTRAVLDQDTWVVHGQKVWTTGAHEADRAILVARTNPDVPKHSGLTMFLLDMNDPGIQVRPLRDMTGAVRFSEVFLDGVRIPAGDVLGEVDDGWAAVNVMLGHERVAISRGVGRGETSNPTSFEALRARALATGLGSDPWVCEQLVEYFIRSTSLELFRSRLAQETASGAEPGPRGSIAKLLTAELTRWSASLAVDLAGPEAVAYTGREAGTLAHALAQSPNLSIGGGTNEVLRNVIGDRVLGLPREPRTDRDIPYRELRVGTQQAGAA